MSSFVKQPDVRQESFDWGTIGWRLTPDSGSKQLLFFGKAKVHEPRCASGLGGHGIFGDVDDAGLVETGYLLIRQG